MTISATTSRAAGISTISPSRCSREVAREGRRGGLRVTSPTVISVISTRAMTAAFSSRQLAGRLLQELPRLLAVFAFPFRVEARGLELIAERRRRRLIEDQALGRQVLLQASVELGDIGALVNGRRVDVLGNNRPHVLRHRFPSAAIGQ